MTRELGKNNNYLGGYDEIYERSFSFIRKNFEKEICLRNFSWFCAHSGFLWNIVHKNRLRRKLNIFCAEFH